MPSPQEQKAAENRANQNRHCSQEAKFGKFDKNSRKKNEDRNARSNREESCSTVPNTNVWLSVKIVYLQLLSTVGLKANEQGEFRSSTD